MSRKTCIELTGKGYGASKYVKPFPSTVCFTFILINSCFFGISQFSYCMNDTLVYAHKRKTT